MAEAARQRLSYAEYRATEDAAGVKHEFVDGVAVAMTGGSLTHARLIARVLTRLTSALAGHPCEVFGSEARVLIPLFRNARYPDASVVCGDLQTDEEDPDAITNPVVLVEVLSDSTEAIDRGEKFREYRTLPSLRCYLLVSQRHPLVERYARGPDGSWVLTEHGPGDTIALPAVDAAIAVDDLYAGTGI
ncbi:MAG: Uma2 family endonuclease [Oligoflexia bacterium]|nr:Uma2 family endonuclease [Oligoflexia bacterium]